MEPKFNPNLIKKAGAYMPAAEKAAEKRQKAKEEAEKRKEAERIKSQDS